MWSLSFSIKKRRKDSLIMSAFPISPLLNVKVWPIQRHSGSTNQEAVCFWLAELRSASPWKTNVTKWLTHNFVKWQEWTEVISQSWIWFCHAYPASLCWELSGFVWFGLDEFGLVWLSLVWYGWVWFGVVEFEFGLVDDLTENAFDDTWLEDNQKIVGKLWGKTT